MAFSEQALLAFDHPLVGKQLPTTQLRELVASEPLVILHFLRHLGCLHCKHSVQKLYQAQQGPGSFPPIYFVHQSPLERAERFFAELFPGARHISDPGLQLYRLFEIQRQRIVDFFRPAFLLNGFKATRAGHKQTEVQGNPFILSGTFLFRHGKLVWSHRARYAGDDPAWDRLSVATPAPTPLA